MKLKPVILPIAVILMLASLGAAAFFAYKNSNQRTIPLVFSNNQTLLEMWSSYKESYVEQGSGRTVDRGQKNISTSEGESYTMLRAVWMDDKDTFDRSWTWTKGNLQRPDSLFAWRYGQLQDGSYGVQTDIGGQNAAADGDTDIALALLMAYNRWKQPEYLTAAKPIIASIWEKEVVMVNGKPVLASNDIERNSKTDILINPSYFAPYAYRTFAKVDTQHDWKGLTDNSYAILLTLMSSPLGSAKTVGLPPDWVVMNRTTGAFKAHTSKTLTTNYGYDAIRIPWRMALDWNWYHDHRDKEVLNNLSYLAGQWKSHHKLAAVYAHDGKTVGNYESIAMYGAGIGYFSVMEPTMGKTVYREKLQTLYNPDKQAAIDGLSYYDSNWGWFGMALAQGALTNLTAD